MLAARSNKSLLYLVQLRNDTALWWLFSWNCVPFPGAPLNSALPFVCSSSVCFAAISLACLISGRCGQAVFIGLGYSFLWRGHGFVPFCFLCLPHKHR